MPDLDRVHRLATYLAQLTDPADRQPGLSTWCDVTAATWKQLAIAWEDPAAPELYQAASAAWHVIQSLLAVRDAATDELLIEVRDALRAAIDKADGKNAQA